MFTRLLLFLLHLAVVPVPQADHLGTQALLDAGEQKALQKANNPSDRFKVYLEAAAVRLKMASASHQTDEVGKFILPLQQYQAILQICSEEMDRNPPLKAGQAKRQEILLRKQIQFLSDLNPKVDLADQALIRQLTESAQRLRSRFLKIFFGSEAIKDPTHKEFR